MRQVKHRCGIVAPPLGNRLHNDMVGKATEQFGRIDPSWRSGDVIRVTLTCGLCEK